MPHGFSCRCPKTWPTRSRSGTRIGRVGSAVRVHVVVGNSRWSTSLFPDKSRATYVLPVKKAVRVAEGLEAGSAARVELTVAL